MTTNSSVRVDNAVLNDSITFENIAANAGIDYGRIPSVRNEIFDEIKLAGPQSTRVEDLAEIPELARGMPGVAILDYDGDGDLDIYVTNGPGAANSLYSNQLEETGQLTFVDVAETAGVAATDQDSTGVSYGDIDNDGDHDLLVLGAGEANLLFENLGDGRFVDITEASGIGEDNRYSSSASMGDVNGDGWLDIVVGNSFNLDNQIPIFLEPFALNEHNQLFLNTGNNTFVDVSDTSGIENLTSFAEDVPAGVATITWAIAMVDYDLDGDLDIIHADDQASVPIEELGGVDRGFIQVFQNNGTGNFTDVTAEVNMNAPGSWMGISFGDFNADGNMDIMGSNLGEYGSNTLVSDLFSQNSRWFLGQDDGTFTDPGVGDLVATPFGWGTSTTDYDNDNDTDIIFYGGLDLITLADASNPGTILKNDGAGNFTYDADALADAADHRRRSNKGLAVGDLNKDGFVDIVSASNFDYPEPVPLVPYDIGFGEAEFGSPFDETAAIVPTFVFTENFEFVWSGLELPDGTLAVEINSADNGNGWVEVQALGTVGLTNEGIVNRDGIGAVVFFTPQGGATVMQPILGGSSFLSQDSLAANFGLGSNTRGTVEVLWPGGVRNRLYNVRPSEKIDFPEIPVSFDDNDLSLPEYITDVRNALDQLVASEVLSEGDRGRFLSSAIKAFQDDNANNQFDLQIGTNDPDILIGGAGRDLLYGRNGDDIFDGGAGRDRLSGGDGDDLLDGGAGRDILSGGNGSDTFVIAPGMGQDIIYFFEDGIDSIQLEGLSFSELEIVQRGSATNINIASTGVTLATLSGIDSTLISEADFS